MTDPELLDLILEEHGDDLDPTASEAFIEWQKQGLGKRRPFSEKQSAWLHGVALKLGIDGGAANIFSKMPKEKQERQRAAAARVVLPWEKK
jgi:hypothetical protein